MGINKTIENNEGLSPPPPPENLIVCVYTYESYKKDFVT